MQLSGEIVKVDEEQGRVFGWAYVFSKNGEQVEDHSGDIIDTPESRAALEDAYIGYVKDHRTGDLDHETFNVSKLIMSAFMTDDLAKSLGMTTEKEGIMVGYEFNRDTPEGLKAWETAKTRGAFSIVGRGRREAIDA